MVCLFGVVCGCMLTVSNALLISSATVMVRVGGLFWLNPIDMYCIVEFFCDVGEYGLL